MSSWLHYFEMGRYGFYVWSSYGVVALVFLMNVLSIHWKKKAVYAKLLHWFKR